ncbi:MAG: peptidylprolyl isomerase [Methylococcales bacterium]|jgi:FKBP-type peptidyl-prolyl cis-trans isomerase SlyD|nr:peptidylprolyl isomerase [Methylococcales bacterium]
MTDLIIEKGKHVQLTYSISDDTGDIVEQSDIPVTYQHGRGSGVFQKLSDGLAGHKKGDKLDVVLGPDDGFGQYHDEMVFEDDVNNVPEEFRTIGAKADFQNEAGDVQSFTVTKIENGRIVMDGNHPFAGKTVTFHIFVVDVSDEKPEGAMENPNPVTIN